MSQQVEQNGLQSEGALTESRTANAAADDNVESTNKHQNRLDSPPSQQNKNPTPSNQENLSDENVKNQKAIVHTLMDQVMEDVVYDNTKSDEAVIHSFMDHVMEDVNHDNMEQNKNKDEDLPATDQKKSDIEGAQSQPVSTRFGVMVANIRRAFSAGHDVEKNNQARPVKIQRRQKKEESAQKKVESSLPTIESGADASLVASNLVPKGRPLGIEDSSVLVIATAHLSSKNSQMMRESEKDRQAAANIQNQEELSQENFTSLPKYDTIPSQNERAGEGQLKDEHQSEVAMNTIQNAGDDEDQDNRVDGKDSGDGEGGEQEIQVSPFLGSKKDLLPQKQASEREPTEEEMYEDLYENFQTPTSASFASADGGSIVSEQEQENPVPITLTDKNFQKEQEIDTPLQNIEDEKVFNVEIQNNEKEQEINMPQQNTADEKTPNLETKIVLNKQEVDMPQQNIQDEKIPKEVSQNEQEIYIPLQYIADERNLILESENEQEIRTPHPQFTKQKDPNVENTNVDVEVVEQGVDNQPSFQFSKLPSLDRQPLIAETASEKAPILTQTQDSDLTKTEVGVENEKLSSEEVDSGNSEKHLAEKQPSIQQQNTNQSINMLRIVQLPSMSVETDPGLENKPEKLHLLNQQVTDSNEVPEILSLQEEKEESAQVNIEGENAMPKIVQRPDDTDSKPEKLPLLNQQGTDSDEVTEKLSLQKEKEESTQVNSEGKNTTLKLVQIPSVNDDTDSKPEKLPLLGQQGTDSKEVTEKILLQKEEEKSASENTKDELLKTEVSIISSIPEQFSEQETIPLTVQQEPDSNNQPQKAPSLKKLDTEVEQAKSESIGDKNLDKMEEYEDEEEPEVPKVQFEDTQKIPLVESEQLSPQDSTANQNQDNSPKQVPKTEQKSSQRLGSFEYKQLESTGTSENLGQEEEEEEEEGNDEILRKENAQKETQVENKNANDVKSDQGKDDAMKKQQVENDDKVRCFGCFCFGR